VTAAPMPIKRALRNVDEGQCAGRRGELAVDRHGERWREQMTPLWPPPADDSGTAMRYSLTLTHRAVNYLEGGSGIVHYKVQLEKTLSSTENSTSDPLRIESPGPKDATLIGLTFCLGKKQSGAFGISGPRVLYSVRNACIGSMDAARRAGTNPAQSAQAARTELANPRMSGSWLLTP